MYTYVGVLQFSIHNLKVCVFYACISTSTVYKSFPGDYDTLHLLYNSHGIVSILHLHLEYVCVWGGGGDRARCAFYIQHNNSRIDAYMIDKMEKRKN